MPSFFCTDASHNHDNLTDELMQQYGCRTHGELHERLSIATAWAAEHSVKFVGKSDYIYDEHHEGFVCAWVDFPSRRLRW
jgi:hypothetical protein